MLPVYARAMAAIAKFYSLLISAATAALWSRVPPPRLRDAAYRNFTHCAPA